MTWKVLLTDEYENWFLNLNAQEQVDIQAMVDVLEMTGPYLKRPYSETISGTKKLQNLKELIIQHAGKPYRVFYAFDHKRQAILLCGGRKDGKKAKLFYRQMINLAEKEYQKYLDTLSGEQ